MDSQPAPKVLISLSAKIAGLFLLPISLSLVVIGSLSYRQVIENHIEPLIGKRLDYAARSIAIRISGEYHLKLVKTMVTDPTSVLSDSEFEKNHRLLAIAQRQNELSLPVYTYAAIPREPKKMVQVLSSLEDLSYGVVSDLDPYVAQVLTEGVPLATPIFMVNGEHRISGLSPLETAKGDVAGVIRVDYVVDQELSQARAQVIHTFLHAGIVAFLLSGLVGWWLGHRLSLGVRSLATLANQVAHGNLNPKFGSYPKDEVGVLAFSFGSMLTEIRKNHDQLSNYSQHLEEMVKERTQELGDANQKIGAMLDGLGQALFLFDSSGKCLPFYSKACGDLLGECPAFLDLASLLGEPNDRIQRWLTVLFSEALDFPSLAALGPRVLTSPKTAKTVELTYVPIIDKAGVTHFVMGIGTDLTNEQAAINQAKAEQENSKLILLAAQNRSQLTCYLKESFEALAEVEQMVKNCRLDDHLLRSLHTLKGAAGLFHLYDLQRLAHDQESAIAKIGQNPNADQLAQLSQGLNKMTAELRRIAQKLSPILGNYDSATDQLIEVNSGQVAHFKELLQTRPRLLKKFALAFDCQPVASFFQSYQSLIDQACSSGDKKINRLKISSGDIPVNPSIYRSLFAAFIHPIRNALDHGVEQFDARTRTGKSEAATIEFNFSLTKVEKKRWLTISLTDDGKGIDPELVRQKLGVDHPLKNADPQAVLQVIFEPGFSTKSDLTIWSGRGVGLDALKAEAVRLGGQAQVFSEFGVGTRIEVTVPYRVLTESPPLAETKVAA